MFRDGGRKRLSDRRNRRRAGGDHLLRHYDSRFSFLGSYIVRHDLRGRGYGLQIWNAAIAHAGTRTIGLDGLVAQQRNYEKSGFVPAYTNVRYGGTVSAPQYPHGNLIDLTGVPLAQVEASDAMVFGRALERDAELAAWGVIRPCRTGHKIGPLIAPDRAVAETVLAALLGAMGGGKVSGCTGSEYRGGCTGKGPGARPGTKPRACTAPIPPLRLDRVYGVTTFELG